MKTKGTLTPAQHARRNAEAFLWHFKASPFSHAHWWNAAKSVPLESAVWELMRRHPNAKEAHGKMHVDVVLTPLVEFVGVHCFKAWSELSKWERAAFVRCLWKEYPAQHEFIPPPVTVLNDWRPFHKYQKQLEATGPTPHLAKSVKRLTLRVQTAALELHHTGHILIAVDPNAPPARITKGVASAVAYWRSGQKPVDTGKARIGQWLDVVEKFEVIELSRLKTQKRPDQLFDLYRRAIQNLPLSP